MMIVPIRRILGQSKAITAASLKIIGGAESDNLCKEGTEETNTALFRIATSEAERIHFFFEIQNHLMYFYA